MKHNEAREFMKFSYELVNRKEGKKREGGIANSYSLYCLITLLYAIYSSVCPFLFLLFFLCFP